MKAFSRLQFISSMEVVFYGLLGIGDLIFSNLAILWLFWLVPVVPPGRSAKNNDPVSIQKTGRIFNYEVQRHIRQNVTLMEVSH